MLIIMVGTIGSGKGTFCRHLAEYGFRSYGVGKEVEEFIKEDLEKRGPVCRDRQQYWGDEARKVFAGDFWDGRIIQKVVRNDSIHCCYDSAKYTDEIERLVEFAKGFGDRKSYVLAINAFPWLRFKRLKERGREGDPQTQGEFDIANNRDLRGYKNGTGQNTSACLDMAQKIIFNHGTPEDLKTEAERFFREL